MASREEMMSALRNADAAGDSEAATRIAGMIRSIEPKAEEKKTSLVDTVLDSIKKASGYQDKPKEAQQNSSLVDMIPGGQPLVPDLPEPGIMDKIYGAGETALSQGAALGGSMLAWPAALGQAGINNLTGSGPSSPPEVFEQMMQGMYQPKTLSGQRQNAAVNENFTRHLMGAFPAMHDATVVGNTKAMRRANEATMQEVRVAAGIEAAKKQAEAAKVQEMAMRDMQEKRSQGGEIPYEQPEIIRGPGESATLPELQLMNQIPKEDGLPFKQDVGADAVGRALEARKQAEIEQAYRQKAFDEGNVQPSSDTLFKQRELEVAAQHADDFIRQSLVDDVVAEPKQRSTLMEPFKKSGISSRGVRNRQRGAMDLTKIYEEGADVFNLALSALTDKVAPLVKRVYPEVYSNSDGTPQILLHATRDDTYGISKKPWDARDISNRGDLGIHLGTTATSPHIRNQAKLHYEPPNTMQDLFSFPLALVLYYESCLQYE